MAFEWVRENIHIFGGQASNVTAVGQSVGAVSINYHMMIPQHRGLFQRAIMQSCAMNSAPAIRAEFEGQLYLDFLVDHFNIPKDLSDKEKLQRVREIPGDVLGRAAESEKLSKFIPYVDGVMVPEDVRSWTHKTEYYDRGVKALIVGDVKDEGSLFGAALASATVEGWTRMAEKYCPPGMEARKKWEALYGPIKTDEDAFNSSAKVAEHTIFTYPDFCTLRALSQREDLKASPGQDQGFELFQFFFDRHLDAVEARGEHIGAHHGIDLVFLFGPDLAIESVFTEEEKELSIKLQTTWIFFAHGETLAKEYFPVRITRSLDDYEYHEKEQEAILYSAQCTIGKVSSIRQGRLVIDFWQESEYWTKESRESEDKK
ncbi:hypothetical protein BGZ76_004801 [Entomortierella beljakovae]|nr:hypothetical protein BGZ76_004801 [Entomortierella beljakovae]